MTTNAKNKYTVAFTDGSEDLVVESSAMRETEKWVIFEDAAWVPSAHIKSITWAEAADKPKSRVEIVYAADGSWKGDVKIDPITLLSMGINR